MFTRNHARKEARDAASQSVLSAWRADAGRVAWIQQAISTLRELEGVERIGVWLEPKPEGERHAEPPVFHGAVWEIGERATPLEWTRLSADGLWSNEALFRGRCLEYQPGLQEGETILGPLVGLQRVLWVPVIGQNLLRGLILIGSREKQRLLPQAKVQRVAAELALLLEFEIQREASKIRQADLALWHRMQSELALEQNTNPILKELVDTCTCEPNQGGVGAVFALIGERTCNLLVDQPAAEERLVICAASGDSAWAHSVDSGPLENLWRQTVESGQVVGAEAERLPLAKNISRIVSIPLLVRGEVRGVLLAGIPRHKDNFELFERLEIRALLAAQALELQRRAVIELQVQSWQEALVDSSPESFFIVDRDGFVRGTSRGARDFLQRPGIFNAKKGQPNRFAELFRPREWESVHQWLNHQFLQDPENKLVSLRAELCSGNRVDLHRLSISGCAFITVGMEAAELEARPRTVEELQTELTQSLEWLQEGVVIFDERGDIRSMNSRGRQILGLTAEQTRNIHSFDQLNKLVSKNAANPESFAASWGALSSNGAKETQEELAMEWPVPQVIERSTRPIIDNRGRRLGRVEVYQDLTTRRMFQSRMLQAEKMASLGQRVVGIIHELSNPLTAILGNAQRLVLRNPLGGQSPEIIHILEEAGRASNILRQLLHLSRETHASRRPFYLYELVERTAKLQRASLSGSHINLHLEHEQSLPPINGDFSQLQQVLLNLLQNAQQAIEHSGKGSTIGVRTEQAGEDHLRLEVWDDGPGIPPEIQARIYDPFFTTKPAGVGTGLGLSVALGFVRQHGGTLTLLSPPQGGAHFVLELPIFVEDSPNDKQSSHSSPVDLLELQPSEAHHRARRENHSEPLQCVSPRVLVVEDEPTVAALIADVLREEGMKVDVLLDSHSALLRTAHESYDLLICDLKMPGIDGQLFHRALVEAAHPLQHRVLFVTGDILAPRSHEFLSRHHLPYLAKPFRVEELTHAVHELLFPKQVTRDDQPEMTSRHVSGNG